MKGSAIMGRFEKAEKTEETRSIPIDSVRKFLSGNVDGETILENTVLESNVEDRDGKKVVVDVVWILARMPGDPPERAWGFALIDIANEDGVTIEVSPGSSHVEATAYNVATKAAA